MSIFYPNAPAEKPLTAAQSLAAYRRGLEWREHYDDYMDSLDGRAGICAGIAAERYADEQMEQAQ